MSKISLSQLIREDGSTVKNGMARCVFHSPDKNPSMSVNEEKGLYKCFSCGASGDVVKYLVDKRGKSMVEALDMTGRGDNSKKNKMPWFPELPSNRIAEHEYRLSNGVLVFVVCRFEKGSKGAKCRPFTPSRQNDQDGWSAGCTLKKGRPLYGLDKLPEDKTKQVWVCEGEKVVDQVRKSYPTISVVSWPFGTKSINLTDWKPLYGRPVLLISDADETGHDAMREIGENLHDNGCQVRICLTKSLDESIKGYDLVDAIKQLGPSDAVKWIQDCVESYDPEKHASKKTTKNKNLETRKIELEDQIRILGLMGPERIAVRTNHGDMLHYSRMQVQQAAALVALAPEKFWLQLSQHDVLNTMVARSLGDYIIREAEEMGHIDLNKVAGRGALMDNERVVWHLGNELIVDGKRMGLADIPDPEHIYNRGMPLRVPEVDVSDEHKANFINALPHYRFQTEQDCAIFIGWLVTSIVGGILEWKPNCWICTGSGRGKSYLKKPIAKNILGDFYTLTADTSAAGLARSLCSDSIPVIIEEAEPDEQWLNDILRLMRIAAGSEGARLRADMRTGGVHAENPRFSTMMLSTAIPTMKTQDKNRFRFININPGGVSNWLKVKTDIENSISPEACRSIRWQIIREAREIMEQSNINQENLLAEGMTTRDSLIDGCLKAGFEWFGGTWWQSQKQEHEIAAMVMLRFILELRISYTNDGRRLETTIGQFIRVNHWDTVMQDDVVRQYGVFWDPEKGLVIAPQHGQLQKLLSSTQYGQVDISSVLVQEAGVKRTENPVRFGGVRHRALIIPKQMAEDAGLELEPYRPINPSTSTKIGEDIDDIAVF